MKSYSVKEVYYTLQGEGAHAGRAALFLRFSGCNLWSGREEDRSNAICKFCDTDFRGTDGPEGGKYTADQLASKLASMWPDESTPYVVCTGGEPLLQLDAQLIDAMHEVGCEIAIETNGTIEAPDGIDWICMSPKANTDIVVRSGDEIKIVFPQPGIDPLDFSSWDFAHFFIQPMDSPQLTQNTEKAIQFCKDHPKWKLSVQSHKLLGIP